MTDEFAVLSASTTPEWEEWIGDNISITDGSVTLAKESTIDPSQLDCVSSDFAINETGNLTVLDQSGQLQVYLTGDKTLNDLSLVGYDQALSGQPDAIGTMKDELYLIDRRSGEIAAFSRHSRRHLWTENLGVSPIAVIGSQKRVYLLEPETEETKGGIRVVEPDRTVRSILTGLEAPVDLTCTVEDLVYFIDERNGDSTLFSLESDVGRFDEEPTEIDLQLPDQFTPKLLGAQTRNLLYFVGTNESGQSQLLKYQLGDEVETFDLPDVEWTSLCVTTGPTGTDAVYLQSGKDGELWRINEQEVNKKDSESLRYEGRLIGRFDSGRRDMKWHRATLDITGLRPDTRVSVNYFTTNGEEAGINDFQRLPSIDREQKGALNAADIYGLWDLTQCSLEELSNILPEISEKTLSEWRERAEDYIQISVSQQDDIKQAQDPTDMLLDDAEGRYLHVDIRLVGNRNSSPRLNEINLYCPRKSYIRYLPEIYKDNDGQTQFFTRFLSLFESVFTDIEEELDQQTKFLDPQEIPLGYLSWLNEWLGLELGETWPEPARRELLSRAPELYKRRGTRDGLMELIQIYLDHVEIPNKNWEEILVRIERRLEKLVDEGYMTSREAATQLEQYRETLHKPSHQKIYFFEHDQLGWVSERDREAYYQALIGHPRRFQILLQPAVPEQYVKEIENIIESDKPVHIDADVEKLENRFRLGMNTYLGVNTVHPDREFKLGKSLLERETVLENDNKV